MKIRGASPEDAPWIAERLRHEDAREVVTSTGLTPADALAASLAASSRSFVALHNDKPAILYGVAPCPYDASRGSVWLVATPDVRHIAIAFLKASSWILGAFHEEYPEGLYALADSRNHTHLRWLAASGFLLHRPVDINGVPFILATHV